jgi:hypothetical protein
VGFVCTRSVLCNSGLPFVRFVFKNHGRVVNIYPVEQGASDCLIVGLYRKIAGGNTRALKVLRETDQYLASSDALRPVERFFPTVLVLEMTRRELN